MLLEGDRQHGGEPCAAPGQWPEVVEIRRRQPKRGVVQLLLAFLSESSSPSSTSLNGRPLKSGRNGRSTTVRCQ